MLTTGTKFKVQPILHADVVNSGKVLYAGLLFSQTNGRLNYIHTASRV